MLGLWRIQYIGQAADIKMLLRPFAITAATITNVGQKEKKMFSRDC